MALRTDGSWLWLLRSGKHPDAEWWLNGEAVASLSGKHPGFCYLAKSLCKPMASSPEPGGLEILGGVQLLVTNCRSA